MIQQLKVNSNDSILCSFDICSLFTNVPLAETIEICTKTLYDGHLPTPVIPKHVFIELMKTATTSVEFSFNNICTGKLMELLWVVPLVPLRQIYRASQKKCNTFTLQLIFYFRLKLIVLLPIDRVH